MAITPASSIKPIHPRRQNLPGLSMGPWAMLFFREEIGARVRLKPGPALACLKPPRHPLRQFQNIPMDCLSAQGRGVQTFKKPPHLQLAALTRRDFKLN
jgi:hypothetical protein